MVKVEIRGVREVVKELEHINKSLKTKMGIIASKGADILLEEAKNQLVGFNAIDTGILKDSLQKQKVESYVWKISDVDYPAGVIPYGIFVELGFARHPIHRSQVNPFTEKLSWFISSDKEWLWVGPMPARPFMSMAVSSSKPRIEALIKQKVDEAIRLK